MHISKSLNNITAIALAFTLILISPRLQADDNALQYRTYMGNEMMGGYGMGPGMMGGGHYGGRHHIGRGMMGGSGMMGGRMGLLNELDLTDEQQAKFNKIQDETRKLHWAMMGEMMNLQAELRDLYTAPKQDNAAIDKTYKALSQLQQKMFETSLDAQKRMEANLTKEQQEKLRQYSRRGCWAN